MRATIFIPLVISITLLAGCNKTTTSSSGQPATVTLNDGTTFSGTVTSSSPSSITLQSSSGESRTYPMTQVSSVQYAPAGQPVAGSPAGSSAPPSGSTPYTPPPAATTPQPAANQAPRPAAAPPRPAVVVRTIPAGTRLLVRNNEAIDSGTAEPGQEFSGVVNKDVLDADGNVAIPQGSDALLVVRSASGQGKFQGQSDIAIDVAAVKVDGREYRLETSNFGAAGKQGIGTNKRTGKFVGSGAALGGIIGAIAGGGKGAGIGLLAGAGAGAATQAATRGKGVRVPAETLMTFRLETPVNIRQIQ
jgi:hypothetical protein